MERMMLIVKGSENNARRVAYSHGFRVEAATARGQETHLMVLGNAALAAAWLCEPGDAPFPAGTLLFYS